MVLLDELSFKDVSGLDWSVLVEGKNLDYLEEDSSSDKELSELKGDESLVAYLLGFGVSKLFESEDGCREVVPIGKKVLKYFCALELWCNLGNKVRR